MIGLNGGLIGVRKVPSGNTASGLWVSNEQVLAQRAGIWPSGGDPDFASVSLLLPFDGVDGSTTFTDLSSNQFAITRTGNATISTAQSVYGGSSVVFDGTLSSLDAGPSAVLALGSDDFTIECYVRPATSSAGMIASSRVLNNADLNYWQLEIISGRLEAQWRAGAIYTARTADHSLITNTWHHVAAVRSGSTLTVYLDGIAGNTTANVSGTAVTEQYVAVGATKFTGFARSFNGYIDDLRITKGVARYTANFTPPTEAFPSL
jgi:hypothetical protein